MKNLKGNVYNGQHDALNSNGTALALAYIWDCRVGGDCDGFFSAANPFRDMRIPGMQADCDDAVKDAAPAGSFCVTVRPPSPRKR